MCPQGDVCHCGRPAVVEFFWPEWAMKLCEIHAPEYRAKREPAMIIVIEGEKNERTRVN